MAVERKTEYQEIGIQYVMKYFIEGFIPDPNTKIIDAKWFYDPTKGTVIFKVFIEKHSTEQDGA